VTPVLADTNAVLWLLKDVPKLSPAATATLATATQTGRVYVSAITIVELVYLTPKPTFAYPAALDDLLALIADPNEPLEVLPVTLDVATAARRIPRDEIPDMPDRIIAATAVAHNLPLVSSDGDIRASASLASLVSVIW
jgi:PIN domain nuclease of toxin-antitoxin system